MAIDTSVPRSRRALLAGGIGGVAAIVASALGRPLPAEAADGEPLVLGRANDASQMTSLRADMNMGTVFNVVNWANDGAAVSAGAEHGIGLMGSSTSGIGVHASAGSGTALYADAMGIGVHARSGSRTGVFGVSGDSANEPTTKPVAGVFGFCDSSGGRGVYGRTTTAHAVEGQATSGVGVHGQATTGYALRAVGRVKLDKCAGTATIAATKTSVVVTPGLDVTTTSFVLLTPKADLGTRRLWYTTDATNNRFTIRVSSAVPANLKVGWLLLG